MNTFSSPRQMEMLWWQPFAEIARERLRHEAREGAELPADPPADLAEGGQAVGGPFRAVEAEVEPIWPGASSWSPWIMSRPSCWPYSITLLMIGCSSENWSMW